LVSLAFCGTNERLAEKAKIVGGVEEEDPSGVKQAAEQLPL
jgi:hypothetical protein